VKGLKALAYPHLALISEIKWRWCFRLVRKVGKKTGLSNENIPIQYKNGLYMTKR